MQTGTHGGNDSKENIMLTSYRYYAKPIPPHGWSTQQAIARAITLGLRPMPINGMRYLPLATPRSA
jgi:hypothetical protein